MTNRLSYDILREILGILCDDRASLYHCALVNWEFNDATSKTLYDRIQYSPPHRHIHNLKDRGTFPKPSILASACGERYATLVTELEISGFIPTGSPPQYILCTSVANAIEKFTNLSKIAFCPVTYHQSLFAESLEKMNKLRYLRELVVNSSCMGDETVPLLIRIENLYKLTLHSPGRVILNALPEWLLRLSPTLVALHLKDNCGSVTPGVLASLLPHVRQNLLGCTLGLSYSLEDDNVFSFLAQIPQLERLQVQYYLQLKVPKTVLNLSRLRHFAVAYNATTTKHEVAALCKYIRRVISRTPVEHIHLICNESGSNMANISFDSIIDHLTRKHSLSLRILDFSYVYVSVDAAKALFTSCTGLEEIYISSRRSVLDIFHQQSSHLLRLHTVAFNIRNSTMKRSLVTDDLANRILSQGSPSLRRLSVNGAKWEGSWVSEGDGAVRFVVHRTRGLGEEVLLLPRS